MESKWHIYQNLFYEITLTVNDYQTYCIDLLPDLQTKVGVCTMIYNFAMKFITDIFDEMHYIDPNLVDVMTMAIKNFILLNETILIEKNEKICQQLAETIMDRIIWDYSGSNCRLVDVKKLITIQIK